MCRGCMNSGSDGDRFRVVLFARRGFSIPDSLLGLAFPLLDLLHLLLKFFLHPSTRSRRFIKFHAPVVARSATHGACLGRRHVHHWAGCRQASMEGRGENAALGMLERTCGTCAASTEAAWLNEVGALASLSWAGGMGERTAGTGAGCTKTARNRSI